MTEELVQNLMTQENETSDLLSRPSTFSGALSRRRALMLGAGALGAMAAPSLLLPSGAEARVGARAPTFALPAVPGGPTRGRFQARDHLGEDPMVILFWATWCQPCRQEMPLYQSLYERYDDRGLKVVGVTMDGSSTLAQAGPLARRLGIRFPIVSDLDTQVTSRLNPRRAAPFSVWVDRRGRIAREHEGFSMSEQSEIRRGIARLVR